MKTQTKYVSGTELMGIITATGMVATRATGVFDTPSQREIVKAQEVLLEHGYYLVESTMVEGHFYLQQFMHESGAWPYYVTLRDTTDGIKVPPLALMYRQDGTLHHHLGSRSYTFGTHTSEAEKMLTSFHQEHGDHPYMWVPVYPDTPLIP